MNGDLLPGPGVSPAWLADRLAGPNPPVVFDLRPLDQWQARHIPGSQPAMARDLPALIAATPARTPIVLCLDINAGPLLLPPFPRPVAVIEGGIDAWDAERLPLIAADPDASAFLFTQRTGTG